jgi:hypothetical protein
MAMHSCTVLTVMLVLCIGVLRWMLLEGRGEGCCPFVGFGWLLTTGDCLHTVCFGCDAYKAVAQLQMNEMNE